MEEKLVEYLNEVANFKASTGHFNYLEDYKYTVLGITCRTDFYNDEVAINALSKLIIDYVDKLDIPYDLVEIVNIDKIKFKDLNRLDLDSYFIRIHIKGIIY